MKRQLEQDYRRDDVQISMLIYDAKNQHELINVYQKYNHQFDCINISKITTRFAKLQIDVTRSDVKRCISNLIEKIKINIQYFDIRSLSIIIWSFAKLDIKDINLFDVLAKEVIHKKKDLLPNNISNII